MLYSKVELYSLVENVTSVLSIGDAYNYVSTLTGVPHEKVVSSYLYIKLRLWYFKYPEYKENSDEDEDEE